MKYTFLSLLLMSLTALSAQQRPVLIDRIVAVVGDHIVLQSEITRGISSGDAAPEHEFCETADQLLQSKIMMLQAERDSVLIPEEEVEAELAQRIRYFEQLLGGRKALERDAGRTVYELMDETRPAIRERRLAEAMRQKVVASVRITPAEVMAWFERQPVSELPLLEAELELGQIVLYPRASADMQQYMVAQLNQYRHQVLEGKAGFEQLIHQFSDDKESLIVLDRNDRQWDAALVGAAFRLKAGELSQPVLSNESCYLLQMIERRGNEAELRVLRKLVPPSAKAIEEATASLREIGTQLQRGSLSFDQAARLYNEDRYAAFSGSYLRGAAGTGAVTISQLDKETLLLVEPLHAGEASVPATLRMPDGRLAVRLLYLQSRTKPHRLNLRDDYARIAGAALEEKKARHFDNWMRRQIPTMEINIDRQTAAACVQLSIYVK